MPIAGEIAVTFCNIVASGVAASVAASVAAAPVACSRVTTSGGTAAAGVLAAEGAGRQIALDFSYLVERCFRDFGSIPARNGALYAERIYMARTLTSDLQSAHVLDHMLCDHCAARWMRITSSIRRL